METNQFVQIGELHTQDCGMEIIVLKYARMDIKELAVLAIIGLLVKKPYFIPYVSYQLVITCGIRCAGYNWTWLCYFVFHLIPYS